MIKQSIFDEGRKMYLFIFKKTYITFHSTIFFAENGKKKLTGKVKALWVFVYKKIVFIKPFYSYYNNVSSGKC